ncbi:MAG: hypoxanthine phosphoribosyltransferase [Saprospiraceae bacterium]|nr:hypoxanthine phosphoribosyltransferase [Saprospiraceae bacterium]
MSKQGEVVKIKDLSFEVYLSEQTIKERVSEIGAELSKSYAGKNPIILAVLNGSFIFAADLARNISIPCELTFIKVSSYDGIQSTEELTTHIGLSVSITGRDVIIVEDIIDSGKTMKHLMHELSSLEPTSISLVTLLLKPDCLQVDIKPDFIGFEIPPEFVVGYGLDYDGYGRNLSHIFALTKE